MHCIVSFGKLGGGEIQEVKYVTEILRRSAADTERDHRYNSESLVHQRQTFRLRLSTVLSICVTLLGKKQHTRLVIVFTLFTTYQALYCLNYI